MKITILTLFPEMFQGPFDHSIVKRAKEKGLVEIELINIRDFGIGRHKLVDDTPYGGGVGMVMRVDVLKAALDAVKQSATNPHVVLMSARGKAYTQSIATSYAKKEHLILICGHYEGVDERISKYIDEEVAVGDFITTGGELPAMLITDSVTRLIKGVLPEGATEHESFTLEGNGQTLIEYPHYTNPREFDGQNVPEVLLSGDHQRIATWRSEKAHEQTKNVRPDLLRND